MGYNPISDSSGEITSVKITPVILSGGAGTRLWPMSRPECPKQFLALTSDKTMFQMTLERCGDSSLFGPPIIVAGISHQTLIEDQLAAIGCKDATILLEPCARNTAPAIALAALTAHAHNAALLVMPSDHVITDLAAFYAATASAHPLVEQGWLVTYGIAPTGPETGYGYIKCDGEIENNVYKVAQFIEKPDKASATAMLATGDHLWNSGIFLFRADIYLAALAKHAPEILAAAQVAMAAKTSNGKCINPDASTFAKSPSDSIDYAVMEKSDEVAVVPVDMGWSDVGSWDALFELSAVPTDANVLTIDGKNNLIRSDGIRIHSAGMEDMIVIASGNDVMIVPRGKSQDVKKIVEALKGENSS